VSEFLSLAEAIGTYVSDGQTLALEGFTHLIPFAAGHEIIRQRKRNLTLVRMTPDVIYDQMIGAGCARKLVFSWGGNPGVGSLHRFRDAIENQWPRPLEIEEHTHAGMVNRFVSGASGLPFALMRGYQGTDLLSRTENVSFVKCPFTDEQLLAIASLNPDVSIIHAQQADRAGNVQLWGITGIQKEAVLSSRKSIVTVEEIVDEFTRHPGSQIIPALAITAVVHAPGGAWPSYAHGYYQRDNEAYRKWGVISKERDTFEAWLEENIYSANGEM
jgi:glutaconate CoA-transferase subunit A